MNMKGKIKRYIIHKLGGFLMEDLPFHIAQDLYNQKINQRIDNFEKRLHRINKDLTNNK